MKLIFSIMESTEMPEFLRRGNMDDGDCEAAALRAESEDESLSAEASNKDVSLRKNAFEQKCGVNVIVHADENNSDSDTSASNFSPHSEVVNGVSEISKDGMSEEETKDTHFNMEPRNGMNKDEDSIDEFGDVGTEFSSQDFVPKTLGLKDEISESEEDDDDDGGGGGGGGGDSSSSYTALKNTVTDRTADNGFNEPSTNPKTNVIQETAQANEHEILEKKCSGEASKSEFYDDDGDCADDAENNDWQGRSTPENSSKPKPSIVEDYLSDENSSDKEVSKVLSDNESDGGELADRQFKEISCENSSESETAKGDASAEAKFKEIEKGISSEEEEQEEEAATLEGKQLKEISEDNFSEDETPVRDSLGDEVSETEKCNASSEHHKDEISEDESIKSTAGEEIREESTERKTVCYDDIHHSSAEECDKTDASDGESDGDSSEYSSPREDDSCHFDDHLKQSDDHISSSDSESVGKGSIGDSEEKSSYSHDFKHKKSECSLSPEGHKYEDVRQDKDETFSENSFDDNILNSSSEDVKAQNYLPQDRICEAEDAETEINKDESERTELRDLQTSVAAEKESSQLASTYNTIEEMKAYEGNTFQTHTEKAACSSSVENEGNENDVDIPLYNKELKCEKTEEESSEVAPEISQKPKTILETELQDECVLESEDEEEKVLNEERNLGTQSCENLSKENIFDSSSIRKPENISDTCQDSCDEKLLQQEDKSVKIGDFSFLSKDNSSEYEDLKHEENRNSDCEENISIGKGSDGNEDNLSCVLNVSDDDRNTNSPCQILEDKEQRALDMKSVNKSVISQDNQSNDGSSPQVKAESITDVTQKDDDGGPFSSGDEAVANNESDDSVKDLVSLDEICETETSVDINEGEHARKTEYGSVEDNDNLFKPQKDTTADSIQEHPEECETTHSLLVVESKESDAGSRETTEDVDFERTINDAQSDLQMESLSSENSRTISLEVNSAAALSSKQHASSVTVEERVSVEGNADMVSDGQQILPSSSVVVSELEDKADVGEIDSAGSAGLLSSETDESEADNLKRSLLESDNPDNDSVDSTGHIFSEKDKSEVDMLNRSLSGVNDPENVPEVVPANINERSLDDVDLVKSNTPNHLENDDAFNDKKFSSDETKSMDSKKEEEKEEGKEEEEEEKEEDEEEKEKEEEKEEGEKGKEEEKVEEEEGEKTEKEGGGGKEEEETAAKEEEKEKHEETKIISTHEECDSASNSSSRNSVQELVQNNSSPDTSKDNSSVEKLPCTEIPKDSALDTSEFQVELNEKQSTNVNENITGKTSQDTNSYSAAEEPGNVDIPLHCSKEEEMDHTEENNSVNIANGLETPAKFPVTEHSTEAPVISDDDGILPENAETSTKIELPLTNGTECQQTLENSAMETDDLKDRLTEERKSNRENTVNDIQSEKIVKKASIMENLTANDSGSHGDQVNNDSRKRKLSSSPEDEPVSKEGCSLQYKGFKKRILAQASLEVADEQMHHQHQTLPKPEELQPDLADSYTTPLTEYAQYLGLQPIVKFKCYLCGETGFPSILSLQEHQSSCLKTSKTRPVSQQPAVPEAVPAESAEGDCPAVGVAAATAAGPADVSGTPSTNFRISRKVYLCSSCGTYYENWNLFLHMKEMHRRFICLFCLTMFTDAGMLATHLSGEHSVTDRLYDTQEGFRAEIADEACFLVCCDCETIFAHTDNFYEHVCPTAPSVEKHQPQQEPKLLQKHRHQQQKQKEIEQSNQHMQGVCSLCGLRGAHFPTCRRASSNSNALTTLVDGSGAVTELSPPDSEQQSEKQPVAKPDTIKKRTGKGKATTKTLPSGDIDAEVDGDEDYDISHAASFCQINIHETPADKPKASEHSASSAPVAKVTLKTKNIPTIVLSNSSATKKNFVSVVKQEPDTPVIHNEVGEMSTETPTDSAVLESQKPKRTAESITVTGIRSGKRGASCSPVPTTEGKKAKFDHLKDPLTASVEGTEEHRGQTSSPVPESDSSSSHSQDSDRLHINTQESESVDGQSCADEDDAAVKEAAKDPEATDADKTEECTISEKQVAPASTKGQHSRDRISESESESSGSANDIPSHKTEDSSSSSEAEVASSSEDRKQDPPPKDAAKQKSEDISDDGGGTAEGPESGGEESSKDSPALVVDEEATDDKKDNGSGSSQPTTLAEGGEIQVAGDDVPALELTLEEQPEVMTLQALVKECVRVSCNSCVFCNHAKKIAVNGSQLALHLLAEHRFEPVVCTDTADLKPVPADGFTARLKEAVHNLHEAFFNTDSYDSTAEPSEVSSAEQGDSSHVYDRSYECFHCHFVTTLHKELYVHNRKMHQKTILLCVMCKSNFYSYSELLCHICPGLYAPDADISFRCCLCTVDKLPSAFRLMVHLRKRHHACDVCLEATGDQQRLSNHVWKHKLHHLCYRCGIAYRNKPDITKHLFWKHGTESVLCKKCLQKKWPHVYHFCIPPTAFNCEECGTSFARAVALKVHRRLHSGDRPYTCEDCPDSFISRKLLARHRRLKHAPPEPSPPLPSALEKNATAQREGEYPGALETGARSVRDSDTDQDKSASENKMSVSLDNRTDNQMSSDGEKQNDAAVKKNKVMDVYDLPPLNLSSDSDDSDEPDNKDSKTVTSPAAVSAPDVKDSQTEEKSEPPVTDSVAGEDEEPAPVQIIDGIWDNFKNYKASLERKEQEAAAATTGSHSTSQASLELKEQEEAAATTESHSTSHASRECEEREAAAAVTTESDSTLPESLELKEQEAAAVTTGSDSTSHASLECKEEELTTMETESYSTSHAIEVIMSDHDYCMVSKPSNLGTVDGAESGEGASLHIAGGLISAEGLNVSDKTIEGDKDSGSNTDSSPETMEATDDGNRSKVVAADSVSAVSVNTGLRVSSGPEKTLTQLSDTGRASVVATEAAPSVPFGTPPQSSNLSTTTSSKKRTKQPRKRQKRDGASSSSSSSSSDSDSSSCSCGTNCSCSSSSSSSSGSSSSSSDSDSSTSEGRRRQAARRERRRERARKKAAAAATAAEAADAVPANASEAAAEPMSRTPTANSVPVAPSDTERECADDVIHESDLETDETETDEDFYDQHPQRQANRLLAEKRNRLMLLAAVAPASNGTAQLAQQLQELNQQQQQHQEQQHHQRQEEPHQQQRHDDQQQTQPVPLQQTLQQLQPQQRVRIGPGTALGDSRKVRTRKRKRAVLSDARTNSASLARSAETVVRPLGTLSLTTYRDSSGVLTQTSIPESTSVSSATSTVRTTGGSGSEGESKRLSKRRRVPKRFYGDSSDEDGEVPVTPQPKWRKTGSGGGGASGAAAGGASVASVGATATSSHVPEPPHLPIRQQVTLPSAAALLSSARSVAAGRRPVETMGHSSSSSSSSSSGSDDADSNYESASDGGGGGGGNSGSRVGGSSSGGVGVGSVTGARTGGSAGAEVDNSGNKSENLYCYCQCPYDEVSEMIACDGKDCQIEWFHFECVGIMVPPKGKWFCPDCRKKSSASRGGEYLLHA